MSEFAAGRGHELNQRGRIEASATQEMLDVPQPFLGDSGQAPSLLNFFNGQ